MKKQTLLLAVISVGALMSATGCSNKSTYTVTFESNGGTEIEAQQVQNQALVAEPQKPAKRPYSFGGWYVDEKLETEYDFSKPVTSNLTLYAKWMDAVSFTYNYHNDGTDENVLNILMYCLSIDEMTGESCGLEINWGDGSKIEKYKPDEIPTEWEIPFTHTYTGGSKTYTVTIRGLINSLSFDATYTDIANFDPSINNGNHYIQSVNVNELVCHELGCKLALGNENSSEAVSQLSQYTLPKDLNTLPEGTFANTSIKSYTANKNIAKIGNFAFFNATKLETVDLTPATSLRSIGSHAFDSSGIESITLPENVAVIYDGAFEIKTLKTVTLMSNMPPYISFSTFDTQALKTIYVPKGRKGIYVSHWKETNEELIALIKEVE